MKLVTKENIPGRREFKTRFNRKLGATAGLFDPISEQLAEAAESLVYEHWLEGKAFGGKVIVTNKQGKDTHYCNQWDHSEGIKQCYRFCPHCGAQLELKKEI
jgi:hypothetical protein